MKFSRVALVGSLSLISASLSPGVAARAADAPVLLTLQLSAPGEVMVAAGAIPVADQLTDASGNVTITSEYTQGLVDMASQNGGYIGFIAIAISQSGLHKTFGFSRAFTDGAWVSGEADPPPSYVDLSGGQQAPSLAASGPYASIQSPGGATKIAGGMNAPAPAAVGCVPIGDGNWTGYTTYGEIHTTADMTAQLKYGTSADSNIGVGVKAAGSSTWTESGTIHISNSASNTIGPIRGPNWSHKMGTQFYYVKWHYSCLGDEYITADHWIGGWSNQDDMSSFDHLCATTYNAYKTGFQGPGTWDRSANTAVTWSLGVNPFGLINLSAQSGYSTTVHLYYTFSQSVGAWRYLCGSDAGINSSKRVFAGT